MYIYMTRLFLLSYAQGTRCIWDAYCAILSPVDDGKEEASLSDPHELVATVCMYLFKMVVDPVSVVTLHRELLVYVHGFCRDMVTRAYLTGSPILVIPADIHYLCLYSDYLAGVNNTDVHLAQTMCHQWTWTRDAAYSIPDTTLDTVILAAWCARVYCQSCLCLYAVNDSLDASAIAQSVVGSRQRISIQMPRINDGIHISFYGDGGVFLKKRKSLYIFLSIEQPHLPLPAYKVNAWSHRYAPPWCDPFTNAPVYRYRQRNGTAPFRMRMTKTIDPVGHPCQDFPSMAFSPETRMHQTGYVCIGIH